MNNAVCFVIDSVVWDCVGTGRAKVSPTPFLDSLKQESIVANKLYSHGPYTDAATRSLFTGRNCLDDYGYFFKLNTAPINHYKLFHDAGFEVYDIHYPFYIKGDKINESIDHRIYTGGFEYGSEWGGLFSYYHDIVLERDLSETEVALLSKRIQYMFESWELYLKDAIYNPETFLMHSKAIENYDVKEALSILEREHSMFSKEPVSYIVNFLKEGKDHCLNTLDNSTIEAYMSPHFMQNFVEKKYSRLFRKIEWHNIRANWKNNMPSIKRILWSIRKYRQTKDSNYFIFIKRYLNLFRSMHSMMKSWSKPRWQYGHSARSQYECAIDVLKKRKSDKPFYLLFHPGEPHHYLAFFSYDIQDKDVIKEELSVIEDYVDKLGCDFKGNLIYLLTLRYTDYQIEKFCNSLKKMGLWKKTSLLITSDHGSSHTGFPLHNKIVNCFNEECYHIPMMIRHPGLNGIEIDSYQYSKDILPTFAEVLGIPQSPFFKGKSMLNSDEKRPFVITEYMGPGCPDMLLRRIWFSARDSHYLIAYKVGVFEDFHEGELVEVYNLENDPDEYYNVNDVIDANAIEYLLNAIEERHKEIRIETSAFLKNING